jgi:hypothetical protein
MARLAELGKMFPCTTEGVEIPVDDESIDIYAGQVLEVWYTTERDITVDLAFHILNEVLRMKEEFPHFVMHYIKIETRKITVQYSLAPVGTTASPHLLAWAAVLLITFFAGLIALYALHLKATRGYVFTAKGTAVITAWDTKEMRGIAGVAIDIDGDTVGKTSPGGSIRVKDIVGPHVFSGEELEDYWPPNPIEQSIKLNEVITVKIAYTPRSEPQPTQGWLHVATTPVAGTVYINGEDYGLSPVYVKLDIGTYQVSYGAVEGYITPDPEPATVAGNVPTDIVGRYILPYDRWWEKYLKWALIGGGAIAGGALLLPPAIRALRKDIEKRSEE